MSEKFEKKKLRSEKKAFAIPLPSRLAAIHLKVNCPNGAREATLGCPLGGRYFFTKLPVVAQNAGFLVGGRLNTVQACVKKQIVEKGYKIFTKYFMGTIDKL